MNRIIAPRTIEGPVTTPLRRIWISCAEFRKASMLSERDEIMNLDVLSHDPDDLDGQPCYCTTEGRHGRIQPADHCSLGVSTGVGKRLGVRLCCRCEEGVLEQIDNVRVDEDLPNRKAARRRLIARVYRTLKANGWKYIYGEWCKVGPDAMTGRTCCDTVEGKPHECHKRNVGEEEDR